MKQNNLLLALIATLAIALISVDILWVSQFENRFKRLEKDRIVYSNKLATAKIISENLNHVEELVFENMDFPGQKDSVSAEKSLFRFLTESANDLKMRIISVRPNEPEKKGRVTTRGYDIEMEGDFFSFGEFCSKLENSRRILSITRFQLQHRGEGNDSSRRLSIKFHLNTYRVRK